MQWSHCSTHFSNQIENSFSGSWIQEPCTAEITSEFILNFLPFQLFQCGKQPEITWCKIWTVRGMWHDFNIAFIVEPWKSESQKLEVLLNLGIKNKKFSFFPSPERMPVHFISSWKECCCCFESSYTLCYWDWFESSFLTSFTRLFFFQHPSGNWKYEPWPMGFTHVMSVVCIQKISNWSKEHFYTAQPSFNKQLL